MNVTGIQQAASGNTASSREDKKLKDACRDFEAIFLNSILKEMRKTVQKTNLFGSSQQEEIFQDMMDSEVCKSASRTQSMGIADTLYHQLSMQMHGQNELQNNATRGNNK
jgi:flagellar protein FlgJ